MEFWNGSTLRWQGSPRFAMEFWNGMPHGLPSRSMELSHGVPWARSGVCGWNVILWFRRHIVSTQ